MNKSQLRKKYKTLRAGLDKDQLEDYSIDIANRVLQLPVWEHSFYHLFLPIEKQFEVNTEYLMHILQGKDKNVVLAKSNFENNTLTNFLLTDTTTLQINQWGIPEPNKGVPIAEHMIDVVFVPLLAYDLKGNRVGYGKGFYDRFLAKCKSETIKIGLSCFAPERLIDGILPDDIKLDYCVSPIKIHEF